MMTIEKITELPKGKYGGYATTEIQRAASYIQYIFQSSHKVWRISRDGVPLCIVGMAKLTLINPAKRIWFLGFEALLHNFRPLVRFLRRVRAKLQHSYPALETTIEVGQMKNERFASFFGFEVYGATFVQDGTPFRYWRL